MKQHRLGMITNVLIWLSMALLMSAAAMSSSLTACSTGHVGSAGWVDIVILWYGMCAGLNRSVARGVRTAHVPGREENECSMSDCRERELDAGSAGDAG